MTAIEKPYAVETLATVGSRRQWVVRRFRRYTDARRFRIAESRRLRIGLTVARLTPIEGGIVTEFEGFYPGTWVRA